MRKLLTAIIILLSFNGYGQPKKDTIPKYDTVIVSYGRALYLDSITYFKIVQIIGSIPPSMSTETSALYKIITNPKNVFLFPQYQLKQRKQK